MSEMNVNQSETREAEEETRPVGEVLGSIVSEVFETLETDRERGIELSARVERLVASVDHANRLEQVVASLHEECRAHRERQFEREVLYPLLRGVINVIDRAEQEISSFQAARSDPLNGSRRSKDTLEYSLRARRSDRVELESLLQTHGIERYRSLDDRFDPKLQRCVKRIPTHKESQTNLIAGRSRPGYRRGDVIVRHEWVSVYVFKNSQSLVRKENIA